MKWPTELLLIRHAESAYNNLKKIKAADPVYARFRELFKRDRSNPELQPLGNPDLGRGGKLLLHEYNRRYYESANL
jgi:hypothetical protein